MSSAVRAGFLSSAGSGAPSGTGLTPLRNLSARFAASSGSVLSWSVKSRLSRVRCDTSLYARGDSGTAGDGAASSGKSNGSNSAAGAAAGMVRGVGRWV